MDPNIQVHIVKVMTTPVPTPITRSVITYIRCANQHGVYFSDLITLYDSHGATIESSNSPAVTCDSTTTVPLQLEANNTSLVHTSSQPQIPNHVSDVSPTDIRKTMSTIISQYSGSHECILYKVHLNNCVSAHSLLNRGANGGITGADTHIIFKHEHCKVDIQGIKLHQNGWLLHCHCRSS